MANDKITLAIAGNLTADPELKFTPSGAAVANFTIASTPRYFDKNSNEWKDGETVFMRCTVWRDLAENVAATLKKGMRVHASGELKSRTFEHEGQKRTVLEMDVDEVGPSLRNARAQVQKATNANGGQQTQSAPQGNVFQQPAQQAQQPVAQGASQGGFGGGFSDF